MQLRKRAIPQGPLGGTPTGKKKKNEAGVGSIPKENDLALSNKATKAIATNGIVGVDKKVSSGNVVNNNDRTITEDEFDKANGQVANETQVAKLIAKKVTTKVMYKTNKVPSTLTSNPKPKVIFKANKVASTVFKKAKLISLAPVAETDSSVGGKDFVADTKDDSNLQNATKKTKATTAKVAKKETEATLKKVPAETKGVIVADSKDDSKAHVTKKTKAKETTGKGKAAKKESEATLKNVPAETKEVIVADTKDDSHLQNATKKAKETTAKGKEDAISTGSLDSLALQDFSVSSTGSSVMSIGRNNVIAEDVASSPLLETKPEIIELDKTIDDDSSQSSMEDSDSDDEIGSYYDIKPRPEQHTRSPMRIRQITRPRRDKQYEEDSFRLFFTKYGTKFVKTEEQLSKLVHENEFFLSAAGVGEYYDFSDDKSDASEEENVEAGTSTDQATEVTSEESSDAEQLEGKDDEWVDIINSLRLSSVKAQRLFAATKMISLGVSKKGRKLSVAVRNARADVKSLLTKAKTANGSKSPTFPILKYGPIVLTIKQFKILRSVDGVSAWFPDELVNSVVWCWREKMVMRDDIFLHTSYVMSMLASATTAKGIDLAHLLVVMNSMAPTCPKGTTGLHLFPTCNNRHWWIMIVDPEAKMIYSIDSKDYYHHSDACMLSALFKVWLLGDEPTIEDMSGWRYTKLHVPLHYQQKDDYNCGAFTCLYMANIAKHGKAALDTMSYLSDYKGKGDDLRMYVFQMLVQLGGSPVQSK